MWCNIYNTHHIITHYVAVENLTVIKTQLLCQLHLHLIKDKVENNQQIVKIVVKFRRYLGTELHSQVGRNYLITQVVVVHGMRISKIMRISSLGKMFKKTLKCGLIIRNIVNINLKKINNVI